MTKKDYVSIASAIRASRVRVASGYPLPANDDESARDAQRMAVCNAHAHTMAEYLAKEPGTRFDRTRFLTACGVQS
jgi:hypothetical protein